MWITPKDLKDLDEPLDLGKKHFEATKSYLASWKYFHALTPKDLLEINDYLCNCPNKSELNNVDLIKLEKAAKKEYEAILIELFGCPIAIIMDIVYEPIVIYNELKKR